MWEQNVSIDIKPLPISLNAITDRILTSKRLLSLFLSTLGLEKTILLHPFVELNFRKSKLLLLGTYHPPSQDDNYYFQTIGNALEMYNTKYEKSILAGDFNAEESEVVLSNFLCTYGLKNLVYEKTRYKSVDNPSCINHSKRLVLFHQAYLIFTN